MPELLIEPKIKLRKDKKNPYRFWFGKRVFNWVNLPYPILRIKKNIIFTIMGIFEVFPEEAPYYLTVKQIF